MKIDTTMQLGAPYNKEEMLAAFKAEHQMVYDFFVAIPADHFFSAPDGVWTPADNLVHLTVSCKPLVMGMKLPKLALRMRFGKPDKPSRSLAAVRSEYIHVALAGGGVATGQYVPQVKATTAAERSKILDRWQKVGRDMEKTLAKWEDADLDTIAVPHPLLGNMTLREILFFTLYHNLHHVRDVQQLLSLPQSEWFDPVFVELK